jgi:hypothetical protein
MAKTPDEMMGAVSASMAERTGRTLDEWVALVQASGVDPLDQNAVRRWLRTEHGVPQNSQRAIADTAARAAGWVRPSIAEYIDGQYTGAKAGLRPIYYALEVAARELGGDVTVGAGGATRRSSAAGSSPPSPPPPGTGWIWGCGSPTRPQTTACSGPPDPGSRPTRSPCAGSTTSMIRSGTCCGWPTSRIPDTRGRG